MYEWLADNGMTPHLVVDADCEGVAVPPQFVEDGQIVLNVSPSAVRGLDLGNDLIAFSARFSGTPYEIRVPVRAVLAIYARENGRGLALGEFDDGEDADSTTQGASESTERGGDKTRAPHLTIIK